MLGPAAATAVSGESTDSPPAPHHTRTSQARLVAKIKIPKKNSSTRNGDLNIDEIKNALRLLPVNRETNLMNLIRF